MLFCTIRIVVYLNEQIYSNNSFTVVTWLMVMIVIIVLSAVVRIVIIVLSAVLG